MANYFDELLKKRQPSPLAPADIQPESDDFLTQLFQQAPPISKEQALLDEYNSQLKRLQAPSPFERPDAPEADPETLAQEAETRTQQAVQTEAERQRQAPMEDLEAQIQTLKAQGNPANTPEITRLQGLLDKAKGPQVLPELKGQPVEPSGMADSLPFRSGDVPAQIEDEAKDLQENMDPPVIEDFRKEEAIQTAKETTQPETISDRDLELAEAQAKAGNLAGLLMMARGAEKIGTSIARTKSDPNYLKEMEGMINKPVEDLITQQKYAAGKLDQDIKKYNYAFAKDMDRPDSNISKLYRETARSMVADSPTLQKNKELAAVLSGNISAAELQKFSPMLFNLVSNEQARMAKIEAAKEAAKAKADKATEEEAKDKKKFTRDLRKELTSGAYGTLYKNASVAQRSQASIAGFMKDPTGYSDYATLMGGLKTLQGDESVVREAEIRLGMQAGSFKEKVLNEIDRLRTGKSLQPKQRENILKSVKILHDVALEQYKQAVQPVLEQAEAEGIDTKLLMPGNILKDTMNQTKSNEVERRTADGRIAIFDSETKKFLRYKGE